MKKLLILASVMFALGGCSESDGGSGTDPNDGKVAVSFVLPGIGVETGAGGAAVASSGSACSDACATRADGAPAPEPLVEGVTVRILAFKQGTDLARPTSDGYAGGATYVATDEGGTIVLKPCTVDDNGKMAADQTGAKPLYLLPGTYDFYAITPAFAPDASAHTSVSVAHGDDFASSKTAGVTLKSGGGVEQPDPASGGSTISGSNGAVQLTVLGRKCSKIVFDVDRKTDTAFDKLEIISVEMSKMTKSPVVLAKFIDDIYSGTDESGVSYIADNSAAFAFPESAFRKSTDTGMDATYPYKWTVESPVLPKKSDTYGIELKVRFDSDAGTEEDPTTLKTAADQIGALAFLPDTRYTFRLKLKGNGIQLILSITPWNAPDTWDSAIGGYPSASIVVGEWTGSWNWSTDVGGYPVLTGFDVETWTPNSEWNSQLGTYLSVVFGSAFPENWNPNAPWGNGLGDYQSPNFTPAEWATPDNTWTMDFDGDTDSGSN